MKTNPCSRPGLVAAGTLLFGALALTAFAGPGPQYWTNPRPATPPAKTAPPACAGCKTTVLWRHNDRGPAGKVAPGLGVAGYKHECTRCTGTIATANGTVKNTMKHDNARCVALACCK